MMKKLLVLLFASVVSFPLASAVFAQEAPAKKEARWEGNIIRIGKDDSSLTVRKVGSPSEEKVVRYDSSTKWVSQYHGDTKLNDISPDQVKEGDRVICTGTWAKSGALQATLISLRLTHSPH